MPGNKTKVDRLHELLPKYFNTRNNVNWKALVEAIGEQDQATADLAEEVRKQFFVKTASRPYLDRLGSNYKIARPKFVGMDDTTFRDYIPVLAYQPKQVKLIIDQLLDIFFFKDSTTAYIQTTKESPFVLEDGWELEYIVDGDKSERIVFTSEDFSNISIATADEVVAAINRQSKYSFAIKYLDNITNKEYIRIFTNTVGSKGSILLTGGRSLIGLKLNGYLTDAGNGVNTEWTVTKIGDTVTFEHTAGNAPGIEFLKEGDIFVSDINNNVGSFAIKSVDIANNKFSFINLFATAGVFTQTSAEDSKFIRPNKFVVYTSPRRAVTWETKPGQIVVEMPTSPPVVKRSLKGSAHINGPLSLMNNKISASSLSVEDASLFPSSGKFVIDRVNQLYTRILTQSEDTTIIKTLNTRFIGEKQVYTYTGKSGNTLTGITPALPKVASLNQFTLTGLTRTSGVVTATIAGHDYQVGEQVIIEESSGFLVLTTLGDITNGSDQLTNLVSTAGINPGDLVTGVGIPVGTTIAALSGNTVTLSAPATATTAGLAVSFSQNPNSSHVITAVTSNTFTFDLPGVNGTATSAGKSRMEKVGLANSGSKIILVNSQQNTGIFGPYMWDSTAPFVLSSFKAPTGSLIKAGQIVRTLEIGPNSLPNQEGFVVFDFGQNNQEGPIRYLYKPTATSIALDPAYVFQKRHEIGSSVVAIRRKGPHTLSGTAKEYPAYITDTSIARQILQDLILSVKSVGIFVEFLVRYPENLYATLDIYNSGIDPG